MSRRRGFLAALRAPLVWRFAPWVFTSILFVEALICIPRIARERRVAFDELEATARQETESALRSVSGAGAEPILTSIAQNAPHVRGAVIESANGELVGRTGESVQSSPDAFEE